MLARRTSWPIVWPAACAFAVLLVASTGPAQVIRETTVVPPEVTPPPIEPKWPPSKPFSTPGPSPVGLAWDGHYFWVSDSQTRRIYRLDPTTGEWDPGLDWRGRLVGPITWDGKGIWVVDEGRGVIESIDPTSPEAARSSVPIPPAALWRPRAITGLVWDGRTLWLCTEGGLCASYYRIDVTSGRVLQSFFPRCEPRGLAFDGSYLWTIGYNGPRRPPRMSRRLLTDDPLSVLTSLSFLWLVPAHDPTALALANGRFWVVDRSQRILFSVAAR